MTKTTTTPSAKASRDDTRKTPFIYTLIGMAVICGAFWYGLCHLIGA